MDDTNHKGCSLEAFATAIAGNWINPATNHKYFFSPDPGELSKGEVSVKQRGIETAIPLRISLCSDENGISVIVENSIYPVVLLEEPEKMLLIEVAPIGQIRLLKIS